MGEVTDIGLWGEYYYAWFYGEGVYVPEGYDLKKMNEMTNSIVPLWNTQHGFMRWNSYQDPHERNEGLLQIAQPRLMKQKATKPAYWEVENIARATKPTTDNKTDCKKDADHSETCFLNWLKDNPQSYVEIFTNFSPCCAINNSKGTGCTESLIQYCNKNGNKQVKVFFYRWYLPQNQSKEEKTEADAENEYRAFLGRQTIPPNLELYKIDRNDALTELKTEKWARWSTAREKVIANEKCRKITNV